jgi:hypothetical protein
MKLIFMACAQSSAVDSQSGRLSLFHLLEQMQAAAFPASISPTIVGVFVKEAGDSEGQTVRLKAVLDETVIFDAPVTFSFSGKPRNRILTVLNGLGIPGPGTLSFSFLSERGAPFGAAWDVVVDKAVSDNEVLLPA